MGRTPVKSTKRLIKAEVETRLKTEAKFNLSELGLKKIFIDGFKRIDPLELAATFGMSFIVYEMLKAIPEMQAQSISWATKIGALVVNFPWIDKMIEELFKMGELSEEQKQFLNEERKKPDFILFVKSFALAYVIVKHSGQIISGSGNIAMFVAGFLGLKAV